MLDHSKQDLPYCLSYNLKTVCPYLDRYWLHEHQKKILAKRKEHEIEEIFMSEHKPVKFTED
jgi:hypothetical protein